MRAEVTRLFRASFRRSVDMPSADRKIDFWYAATHTEVLVAPKKALETFGTTIVNYHLVAELPDDPRKVRIREGRLEAHKPALITPEAYVQDELDGFGEEARRYYEFLKEHEDSIRILQYGYSLRQEAFSEQVVTDSIDAVLGRIVEAVKASDDPLTAVIKGVDDPWDVCLIKFFWLEANASIPFNIRDFERAKAAVREETIPVHVRNEVEEAFAKAQTNPALVQELGSFLRRKGLFEQYQDRFFKLVRRG